MLLRTRPDPFFRHHKEKRKKAVWQRETMSRQLRAVGNTTNLEQIVERAKVLMVVDSSEKIAAIQSENSEVSSLKAQIQELTEQVAVLTTQKSTKK